MFQQALLKDHIRWFTKMGSVKSGFPKAKLPSVRLRLQALDKRKLEWVDFGHRFPDEAKNIKRLFKEKRADAPKYYCKADSRRG